MKKRNILGKFAIVLITFLAIIGIATEFFSSAAEMNIEKNIQDINRQNKEATLKINNLECLSIFSLRTYCSADIDIYSNKIKDSNSKKILELKNTRINISDNNIELSSLIVLTKKDILNKFIFFTGNENNNTDKILDNIQSNLGDNHIFIKINNKGDSYKIKVIYKNNLFTFVSKNKIDYIEYKKDRNVIINNKEYPLPKYELLLKNSQNEFSLNDRNLSKSFFYNIYKLNYFYIDNKSQYNEYLFEINNAKMLTKKEFDQNVKKHILEFKNQKLDFFNIFTEPLSNIYLDKEMLGVKNYKLNFKIIENTLKVSIIGREGSL